jgi:uncharacterized protein
MGTIIGRDFEINELKEYTTSPVSEFIVVYGRRRVGKTFLIRETFNNAFHFYLTGLANATTEQQLQNFVTTLSKYKKETFTTPTNWIEAFQLLIKYIEKIKAKSKLIFIDEMPWLDTPKSDFIMALEHFWNHWASAQKNVKFIVCGSATSWINDKLINNKGGLHNRVTKKIKLLPFTLYETELFLKSKNIFWERYQIAEIYMTMGGIPYYLNELKKSKSATLNIQALFFEETGLLRNEFENLYASLFRYANNYIAVVEALSKKNIGLTRNALLKLAKLSNGGGSTKVLEELEQCSFIRKYIPYGRKTKDALYQLTDFYTLFYFNFIHNKKTNKDNYWVTTADSPKGKSWAGYAFEQICATHLPQLKKELGINGIQTDVASWRSKNATSNVQIDLIIDRNDQSINICEIKFSINTFIIDKKYAENLRNKIGTFKEQTKTRKSVFLTFITTYGVAINSYATQLVTNNITMDAMFKE